MKLLFIRHAIAMERADFSGDDLLRPLTPKGRERAYRAFLGLQKLYPHSGEIWHSEAVRSRQTAEALHEVYGAPLRETHLLNPGAGLSELRQLLYEEDKALVRAEVATLVGHEPDFSEMISGLLVSPAVAPGGSFLYFDIKKASCVEVELLSDGRGELRAFLTPKVLRQLAAAD